MSELNKEIKAVLMAKLKGVLLKFAENVVAPVAPIESIVAPVVEIPVKLEANTGKLKDGTIVSYEGELEVGVVLNVVAEDGTMSVAPEGSHELEDGTVVTITNGVVSEIKTMLPQMAQAFSAIELKFAAEKKENESLKAELAELKDAFKTTLLAFQTIIEAPVVESTVARKAKSYEEMTAHEKTLFNRGKI
jgi:hypothetical protein